MEISPIAIVSNIRENLHDRYRSGFPIVKELVQNAEDAGATRLALGLAHGLPAAHHPLLRGPAVFLVNDGPFSAEDAEAINSVSLSSKMANRTAIGKFGLGLKSVFHRCAAFFYQAYHAEHNRYQAAIVSPWADHQEISAQIPRVDLQDLRPFFEAMLTRNRRRIARGDDGSISFKTPEAWLTEPGVRSSYQQMIFNRQDRARDATQRLIGIGSRVLLQALRQAKEGNASATVLASTALPRPLLVFRIYDQVTGIGGPIRTAIAGIEVNAEEPHGFTLLQDWHLLMRLNEVVEHRDVKSDELRLVPKEEATIGAIVKEARQALQRQTAQLDLPFRMPTVEPLAILWPGESANSGHEGLSIAVDTTGGDAEENGGEP